jgi:hypothetical protein
MHVTEAYFMIIGCLICGCRFEMWGNFHNAATRSFVPYNVRVLYGYRSHTVLCVHAYLACPVNQDMSCTEVAAGMCEGCTFLMRRNIPPKYAKRLWTWRLFSGGRKCGHSLLRVLAHRGWSKIQEFRLDDEKWLWDFAPEYWLQNPKERYKISRSNSCLELISRNAQIFSHWRLFLNFSSIDFISFCHEIGSVTFLITVFVIRTTNIP